LEPGIAVMCVLAGLLMLDKYSLGEFGVSQPLVVAPILGFAAGDFHAGVLLGVLLQPVWLVELPVGRRMGLDAQAAGISGAVAFFVMRGRVGFEQAMLAAVLVAAGASLWGGWLDRLQRHLNGALARRAERARTRRGLFFIHAAALELAFLRGVVLAVLAAGVGFVLLPVLRLDIMPGIPVNRLLAATMSIGLAGALVLFGVKKRIIPVLAGFASWVVVWVLVRF